MPPDLEALLLSCLAKNPGERPQSAQELRRRLRACEDFGGWTEHDARQWWTRHGEALAERRRRSVGIASGQSLVIDLEHRGELDDRLDSGSLTRTGPGRRPESRPPNTGRGDPQ